MNKTSSLVLATALLTLGATTFAAPATADHPPIVNDNRCLADDPGGWIELCWSVAVSVHTDVRVDPEERVDVPTPANVDEWLTLTADTLSVPVRLCPLGEPCLIDETINVPILEPNANPQFEDTSVNKVIIEADPEQTNVQPFVQPHAENVQRDVCTTAQAICDLLGNPPSPCESVDCNIQNPCESGCNVPSPCRFSTCNTPGGPVEIRLGDQNANGRVDGVLVRYLEFDHWVYLSGDLLDQLD